MSGRIIDADVDAIANITRLTGQIETMKRERDAARICFEIEREDRRKSDAQRDELQGMLTACEEEKEAQRVERTELFYDCETAENRVLVLEEALRTAKLNMKPNAIWALDKVDAALAPTPAAETPAPTCKRCAQLPGDGTAICDDCRDSRAVAEALLGKKAETPAPTDDERQQLCDKINEWKRRYFLVADAVAAESISAEQLAEIARKTRAELAAANERISLLNAEVDVSNKLIAARDELVAMFDCPAHGVCIPHAKEEVTRLRAELAAANERITFLEFSVTDRRRQKDEEMAAHAATTAKLGRAVAALQLAFLAIPTLCDCGACNRCKAHTAIGAILADDDSKVTP